MSGSGEGCGQGAGNVVATSRDATGWSFRPEFGGPPAAGADQKAPPAPRAGFASGGQAEGGRAEARYVHTPIGTSSPGAWRGSSREGVIITRRREQETLVGNIVTSLNACGRDAEAKAVSTCGRCFRKLRLPCGNCDVRPLPCDHILCPKCASARARELRKKVSARCLASKKHFQFLTLTVPNVPRLTKDVVRKLSEDFAKLRRSEAFTCNKNLKGFGLAVSGGIRAIECTFVPKTRSWHPHIHVLIEGPRRFSKERLSCLKADWQKITGGAKYLHLQRLYRVSSSGKKILGKVTRKSLRELVKYITKAADFALEPALVDEFVGAFEGVRRVQAFGSFLGVFKDAEREPGDESESFWCRHCNNTHLWKDCKHEGVAAFDEVERLPDGTWQLKFDFVKFERESLPDKSPPWELTPEEPVTTEQVPIEFPGVMPEKSERQTSLFDAAA